MQQIQESALQDVVRRALEAGKLDLVQVWFQSSVLDRYRGDPDSNILRSDSAGRLRGPGGWMINFGISPDDALIHMPIATALILPEGHREHWLSHVVGLPVGANFLRMVMTPGACIGDGDSRPW
jgi:hypothetical protein